MTLPEFNPQGDLPTGIYQGTIAEIVARFGSDAGRRGDCTRHLQHIYILAQHTGHLERFILFGSYITAKPDPNDIDVVLVMKDSFSLETCPIEARGLFDHAVAQARHGSSIFWIRPALLIHETIDDFIAYWQIKRDGSRRGIVEVVT